MFENPRRVRQARNFTTNVPKILDLKSSSEQVFSRKLPLGAPELYAESARNFCSDLPVGIGIKRIKKMQTTTIIRANQGVPPQVQIN